MGTKIQVTRDIALDEKEIRESFVRASGPGGQNVNKVATAVRLVFDVRRSASLPQDVRERLMRLAGRRINREGTLIIEASRFRTQAQNRQDARARLVRLIRQAAIQPKVRHKTRLSLAAKERRLENKRRRSEAKRSRAKPMI